MSAVIKVENISKRYFLGHKHQKNYKTLRESVSSSCKDIGRRILHPFRSSSGIPLPGGSGAEEFWALKDLCFSVNDGDRLAIIGRNGAGKSTLLKILSRITEPTKGRAVIKGRVASLLEVGTGFHPELSGRENIFLNGAVLGMRKEEIRNKFDEIVDFAGVEKFLDTPVKRYSSGMYVRLAFSVAAHIEPEILIIDEVLAVGDMQFQNKCLEKMDNIGESGRTVLFVSHNMSLIRRFCSNGLFLDRGKLSFLGDINQAIDQYSRAFFSENIGFVDLTNHCGRRPGSIPVLTSIGMRVASGNNNFKNVISTGETVEFVLEYDGGTECYDYFLIGIHSVFGERIATISSAQSSLAKRSSQKKDKLVCEIPTLNLAQGEYYLTLVAGHDQPRTNVDVIDQAMFFEVHFDDYFGNGELLLPGQGSFAICSFWRNEVSSAFDI